MKLTPRIAAIATRRCPFCHDLLGPPPHVECEACRAAYHVGCATRCAALGCARPLRRVDDVEIPRTLTLERWGFWSPELVLSDGEREEVRVRADGTVRRGGVATHRIRSVGACGHGFFLRDARGRLAGAAFPFWGGGGYRVVLRREGQLTLEREGFLLVTSVVARREKKVLVRFESSVFAPVTAVVNAPLAPEALGFLAWLRKRLIDQDAATAAMII